MMVWSHSGQPGEGAMEDDEGTDSEDEEEGMLFLALLYSGGLGVNSCSNLL